MVKYEVPNQGIADRLGVDFTMVSRIRRGKRKPSIALMGRIKDLTGWTIDDQVASQQRGDYPERFIEVMGA